MKAKELASHYRLKHWVELLRERTASGEEIKDFCRRIGVSRNAYFYWQRKVRGAACQALMPQESDSVPPSGCHLRSRALTSGSPWSSCDYRDWEVPHNSGRGHKSRGTFQSLPCADRAMLRFGGKAAMQNT